MSCLYTGLNFNFSLSPVTLEEIPLHLMVTPSYVNDERNSRAWCSLQWCIKLEWDSNEWIFFPGQKRWKIIWVNHTINTESALKKKLEKALNLCYWLFCRCLTSFSHRTVVWNCLHFSSLNAMSSSSWSAIHAVSFCGGVCCGICFLLSLSHSRVWESPPGQGGSWIKYQFLDYCFVC